jgi:hypothetical protein
LENPVLCVVGVDQSEVLLSLCLALGPDLLPARDDEIGNAAIAKHNFIFICKEVKWLLLGL